MQFTPKTDEALKSSQTKFKPLPDGDYPFTVLESSEGPAKKNPSKSRVELKLAVHDGNRDQWVWDYFADWFSEWKLKHFLEATGNGDHYAQGSADFSENGYQGAQGYVRIKTEKDNQGRERNTVDDYIVQAAKPDVAKAGFSKLKEAVGGIPESDDVPF